MWRLECVGIPGTRRQAGSRWDIRSENLRVLQAAGFLQVLERWSNLVQDAQRRHQALPGLREKKKAAGGIVTLQLPV